MIWLVNWLPVLKEGIWPPEHRETGYIGLPGTKGHRAPFEDPAGFAGEVNIRLSTTGEAGEALVDEVQSGLELEQLSRPARRALNYISGWRRRRLSYRAWVRQVDYRAKKDIIMKRKRIHFKS